jgi:integrase
MAHTNDRGGAAMKTQARSPQCQSYQWPVNIAAYDRRVELTIAEREELQFLVPRNGALGMKLNGRSLAVLQRLAQPIKDVLSFTKANQAIYYCLFRIVARRTNVLGRTFWGWTESDWIEVLCPSQRRFMRRYKPRGNVRPHLMAVSYLLCDFAALRAIGAFIRPYFAGKVFGDTIVKAGIKTISDELLRWGYTDRQIAHDVPRALCEAFLLNRTPHLEDLTTEVFLQIRENPMPQSINTALVAVSRALVALRMIEEPLKERFKPSEQLYDPLIRERVAKEWLEWSDRWMQTSTHSERFRRTIYYQLLKAGRWLAQTNPKITSPAHWTRELAAEYVAAVDRMKVGEWSPGVELFSQPKLGQPLKPRSKAAALSAMRIFFRNCYEWGWMPLRFDARRCFSTPRSIRSLIGPNPRVIADDIWTKLLWAGLNLTSDDMPLSRYRSGQTTVPQPTSWYPLEMVKALIIVWLFAGLRANEIGRLRVGCIRWQHDAAPILGTAQVLPKDVVCLLDVPTNKTGTAFTKPVDRIVGEAIVQWEQLRPDQPALLDPKTSELVHYLFLYRGRRIGIAYINEVVIPVLCRKAGVPTQDARGKITSHRARSTIASQLYNAKEPMSLFELQEWLGHRSPETTRHYAKFTPTKLAKSYTNAGYFERNVRRIEVLIDQAAVRTGLAAQGEPWKFYDLGHGYCAYDFFEQCPHRMACAKCSFYFPKDSSKAQLLEGRANLQRMMEEIPLTDEERSAVEDGIASLNSLTNKLADIPTPDGRTPKQLVQIQPKGNQAMSTNPDEIL